MYVYKKYTFKEEKNKSWTPSKTYQIITDVIAGRTLSKLSVRLSEQAIPLSQSTHTTLKDFPEFFSGIFLFLRKCEGFKAEMKGK